MNFAAMLRVRNEARWIERSIKSLIPLCEHIFVMNDHSEDATAEIASSFDQVTVWDSPFDTFSETRDKGWLLSKIVESKEHPEFVICIDGDEELEPRAAHKLTSIARRPIFTSLAFRIRYLWDQPDQYRADGIYGSFTRPSMWRFDPTPAHCTFASLYATQHDTTLHCTNVPTYFVGQTRECDVELLHWGYFDKRDRVRKYWYYNRIDPDNELEDRYRHMVIGDLWPEETKMKHGGPLRLQKLVL